MAMSWLLGLILMLAVSMQADAWMLTTSSKHVLTSSKLYHNAMTRVQSSKQVLRDEKGYEIKPREWFNGLSLDPGASLTDPRAVPPECKQFAEDVKANKLQPSMQDSLALVDKHYNYFEVPFSCAEVQNKANENIEAAKLFCFALMTQMNEEQTIRLFGGEGNMNDKNLQAFKKYGWSKVSFGSGLAIVSKLMAYDDTDTALATQSTIEGSASWDVDSDSWIP